MDKGCHLHNTVRILVRFFSRCGLVGISAQTVTTPSIKQVYLTLVPHPPCPETCLLVGKGLLRDQKAGSTLGPVSGPWNHCSSSPAKVGLHSCSCCLDAIILMEHDDAWPIHASKHSREHKRLHAHTPWWFQERTGEKGIGL